MRALVRVEGLSQADFRFQGVAGRALRPEPALRSAGTLFDLQQSERRRFNKRVVPAASAAWVREKRSRGLDPRTLRARGHLQSALTNATHGVELSAFNRELRWGIHPGRSDVYYAQALAKKHRSWRVVVIDKEAKVSIGRRVQTYIADGDLR